MSVAYEALGARPDDGEEDEKDTGRKLYGVVPGYVLAHLPDPLGLGRVPVHLPCIDSVDQTAFARIATLAAGPFSGSYFVPNPGDHVLVAFEHGDVNVPYIIGCLWNSVNRPPVAEAELQVRTVRTLAGNQVVFEELPPTVTIQSAAVSPLPLPLPASPVGPHQTIQLSPVGAEVTATTVLLQAGENKISLTPAGIVLQAGANVVSITASGISLVTGETVSITGGTQVQILGAQVAINS